MDRETVLQLMRDAMVGFLATSVEGAPRVRPMSFVVLEDGRLWSSTYRASGKLRELERNPRVEVAFACAGNRQVRVRGRVNLSGGVDEKRRLLQLNPKVARHFPTADDPRFVHLELVPELIRWKEPGFNEYQEVAPR